MIKLKQEARETSCFVFNPLGRARFSKPAGSPPARHRRKYKVQSAKPEPLRGKYKVQSTKCKAGCPVGASAKRRVGGRSAVVVISWDYLENFWIIGINFLILHFIKCKIKYSFPDIAFAYGLNYIEMSNKEIDAIPGKESSNLMLQDIESCILSLRGQQVILDRDLAMMYGVETRTLNQAVKRNIERFPEDFMFKLSKEELASLKSQFVISNCTSSDTWGQDIL